ncbi:MAG: cell division protein ZapA [Muribaculaceae bacterium]|nr:cell division protein ZapA [Muribaculaceae bacterium]
MENDKEHRITVKIADIEPFKIGVSESEESFYRQVIERINENVRRLQYNASPDSTPVAVAKVALYYATMLYHRSNIMTAQTKLLENFEKELDELLQGTV